MRESSQLGWVQIGTVAIALSVSGGTLTMGCSSEKEGSDADLGAAGAGASTGSGSGGASSASGGAGSTTGGSAVSTGGTGSLSGDNSACGLSAIPGTGDTQAILAGDFEQCASETREAEAIPADIFIMLDQSISMGENYVSTEPDAPTRWEALTSALTEFIESPDSSGLRVGIQYFGLPGEGAAVSCEASDYAQADVDIAALPGNAEALTASIAAHYPSNLTPSVAALEGALTYAKAWAEDHPERPTILVFATDGYPTDCEPRSISDLEDLADQFAHPTDGSARVSTFVVGVGRLANLDRVAKAGGTDHAFLVDDCPTAVEDLLASLKRVANSPALCDFELPEPPAGEVLDFDKVNLVFSPRGGEGEIVKRVDGADDCVSGGWYYDDADAPKSVEVCPSTCSQFGGGVVDLVLGCETIDLK